MAFNLHAVVRSAIQAVNPDIPALWIPSRGYTVSANGLKQTPVYGEPCRIRAQVQPASNKALAHPDYMNMGGTLRSVYMYGYPQSLDRVEAKGGDLLQFPQHPGAPVENWYVFLVDESGWSLPHGGWAKVSVVLQTDRPAR